MELQEKIDQYVLNQLNKADKAKFEELISSDKVLQNEVALQKSIAKVFNQTGSAQLKARLNQVPVSMASTGNALIMKWIGAGVAASVLAGLIIFLMPSQKDVNTETTSSQANTTIISPSSSEKTEVPSAQQEVLSNNTTSTAVNEDIKTTNKKNIASSNAPQLEAYTETTDFSEVTHNDLSQEHQQVNMPSSNLSTENNKLSNLSVTINDSNPAEKSYQFSGAKLTLFGDFATYPYELLELNHKNEKALYLSYQNEFYELVWGKSTKTPLNKVTNKQTIEKLKLINH